MISSGKERRELSVAECVAEAPGDGWRVFVVGAGDALNTITPEMPSLRRLRALVGALGEGRGKIEDAVDSASDSLFRQGLLLGYALARTWPSGADGMEEWPRRALEMAGLVEHDEEDGEDG